MTRPASTAERVLRLARDESAVDEARRFAEAAVSYCTPECREAVALAVSELGENLIKYGEESGASDAGLIGVSVENHLVRVRARNRVTSALDAARVAEIVAELSGGTATVEELYSARMKELFNHPELPRAQLGLLRMAFEGGFRLRVEFEAPELQIIAERSC